MKPEKKGEKAEYKKNDVLTNNNDTDRYQITFFKYLEEFHINLMKEILIYKKSFFFNWMDFNSGFHASVKLRALGNSLRRNPL